uniref:WD repeat-containing protein n=1 Tax=Coccidioides posadasii RMSCC 3488 TaxID=454284 RepID=A0A0J6FB91_COCPO|nr:WD repeat-containing protein [Coccidioides posadasii RMSCC 3488]
MKSVIYDRLLQRELGKPGSYAGIRGIYGDKLWVDDMDIVNELGGHTGCVNALNWSTSGKLLASGSDDQHVNIYSYQPESTTSPFFLNTTILTGHSANIFSVKFMPHSNDRTLISCAGDSEVRVFDIEYSGRSANTAVASARSRRFNNFFNGMWYLTEGNTNCRVYRSHADRVKRIVTESSPYLFLTCSEDGEVRQWDLRQPSSAYPSPRGGQGFMAYRPGLHHDDSNVPPPLISYKKYHIDLNTISCAASQPHYIALGGAHLHCFLHDRRMMGRDLLEERGQTGSLSGISSHDDEVMGQATRCVRRFAPNGQKKMRSRDNGHITACKISYANPNEMIVSWSGDHIYSFDLIRSPDARDGGEDRQSTQQEGSGSGRAKKDKNRKRKRGKAVSPTSLASSTRHQSRLRSEDGHGGEDMSFRVRYGNGESEDIPLDSLSGSRATDVPEDVLERARESVLNEAQKLSLRIAKGLVEIRKLLFSVDRPMREFAEASPASGPTPYTASFTSVLGYAATYLPEMDEVIRTWRYPLNPSHDDVLFQQALRRNRESSRRFVQASGTLARVLGGRLQTATGGESPQLALFRKIGPAPTEDGMIDPSSQFGYDFLKAILLWLEGGRQAILEGFKRRGVSRRDADRFPLLESAEDEAIEETLIPYFRELAGTEPIVNVDASRFEHNESRILFESQSSAVEAFAQAIRVPLEDLVVSAAARQAEDGDGSDTRTILSLDKNAAIRFWGLKVGRGILMEVGEGVNFEFVNRAFGGLRTVIEEDEDEDDGRERLQEDIDPDEEEEPISEVRLITGRSSSSRRRHHDTSEQNAEPQETSATNATEHSEDQRASVETDEEEDDEDDSEELDEDDEEEDDDDDDDEDDDERDTSESDEEEGRLFIRNSSSGRRRGVESHVPCSSHLSVYRGHCNIKTVKDVNYFGLNDEYVVSGSDCGNIFIWDRKTSDLVNILSGDSDVVNVVQGHPYEPTLAVSGIDNTIKIFSPDARAQHDASVGINIADPDAQANIVAGNPAGGNRTERSALGLRSRKRMQDSYQITSQNDVNRQGGMNEAFITRSMLARLAASLRERQAIRVGFNTTEGEEGGRIVLDENCNLM